jgi:flagellar basal-body rod modification protein FlgD
MAVDSTNSATSTSGYSYTPASKSGAVSDANAAQDRFLKLLVAQLANQDPMNPMDNAQMTSQMAQINTVSGIQQVNASIQSMSQQFALLQTLQSAQFVGHDVLINSDTLPINKGMAQGAFEVKSNADQVKVKVLSKGGNLLDTVDLGAQTMGRHDFQWSNSKYPDLTEVRLQVVASAAGSPVNTSVYSKQSITGVENGQIPQLQLQSGNTIDVSTVAAFY